MRGDEIETLCQAGVQCGVASGKVMPDELQDQMGRAAEARQPECLAIP